MGSDGSYFGEGFTSAFWAEHGELFDAEANNRVFDLLGIGAYPTATAFEATELFCGGFHNQL